MRNIVIGFLFFLNLAQLKAQSESLQAGPMVGYGDLSGVSIWVQTKREAIVKIKYYEEDSKSGNYFFTKEYSTIKSNGFTALLMADKILPAKKYTYELYINGIMVSRPFSLSFKTDPINKNEPEDFKVAMGSCVYVNDSLMDKVENLKGGGYSIYSAIVKQKPDMMLWLGDNVYFRKNDWVSKEGMIYRYTHTRSLSQMQPLLGSTQNIAIWDDHDYGPNDSDKSFKNKHFSLEAFNLFWANPKSTFNEKKSVATTFSKGDVQFFLLDDRTFRSPKETDSDDKKELLGEEQLSWLLKELKLSKATFKIIAMGGQVLNPLKVFETYANYKEERGRLLSNLEKEKITGVVFLSGDRHFSEAMKMERNENYSLFEFTVSPLNSGPVVNLKEVNPFRIPSSLLQQYNFATMEFYGVNNDRAMRIQYRGVEGDLLFEKIIKAVDLK